MTETRREHYIFKVVLNVPISHISHPTHRKTLEIMRSRFKMLLLRHFPKAGGNPTINNTLKSRLLCVTCTLIPICILTIINNSSEQKWSLFLSLESEYHLLRLLQHRFHSGENTKEVLLA